MPQTPSDDEKKEGAEQKEREMRCPSLEGLWVSFPSVEHLEALLWQRQYYDMGNNKIGYIKICGLEYGRWRRGYWDEW